MRELTFAGFLRRYVRELSAQDTLDVSKLAQEAQQENPRLREPLFLYAVETGKVPLLLTACIGSSLAEEYKQLVKHYDAASLRQALQESAPELDACYHKVWNSYLSLRSRPQSDAHTKELMRTRVLLLQKEKRVTNYRLYTDLRLNPGNINAWLKHGNGNKVSLAHARQMLQYLRQV